MGTRLDKLERKLARLTSRACQDFGLLEPGDRVMVCLSGGKDSYTLLEMLRIAQRKVPFELSLVAVNLDQKQPGFPAHVLPEYLSSIGVEHRIVERDTYSVVVDKIPEGKTYCSLCSRLRRGILYDTAVELGATKIALGHHRDDVIETALLNLLYSGQLKAMPPKLISDDRRNTVIRPLIYIDEKLVAEYAELKGFPIIPCDLCGSQENLKRKQVKRLIAELAADNPTVPGNMFTALTNVRVSHLLDRSLWERLGYDELVGQDDDLARLNGEEVDEPCAAGAADDDEPRPARAELSGLRMFRG